MFRKLVLTAALAAGVVAFVGTDVVRSTWSRARSAVRESLSSNVPLQTQLAEARAQIDAYAEHVIKAEVAAEGLARTIAETEREVRGLAARVERERSTLAETKERLSVTPTGLLPAPHVAQAASRSVQSFRSASATLERRTTDLATLRQEHASTLAAIAEAQAEQTRLAEEVRTLAAEIQSLEARQSAARTRASVGDGTLAANGFAAARERLDAIRASLSEKDRLLRYYEVRRGSTEAGAEVTADTTGTPAEALAAIDEALAAWPATR